jgi:hypothetical protein
MAVTRAVPPRAGWVEFLRSAPERERVELAVSEPVRRVVATAEDLARNLGEGVHPETGTLLLGGRGLNDAMVSGTRDIQLEFHDLGAEFVYPLAPLLNEIRIQSGLLVLLADTLNIVEEKFGAHVDAGTRKRWAEARELYVEGCGKAAEHLFPEALEWLLKAEERYPTDFTIQFELGWVYLYGVSREDSVVDLQLAEEHLRRATRYGKGAIRRRPEMAAPTAEAMVHLSVACRLRAEPGDAARLEQALALALEARHTNPKLSQACYHAAKYAAALGHGGQALELSLAAIGQDRRFALTADADEDLTAIRPELERALAGLRDTEKGRAEQALARLDRLDSLRHELSKLEGLREKLAADLEPVVQAGTGHLIDQVYFPGKVTEDRTLFDNESRGVRRALNRTAVLCERSALALDEAGRLLAQARASLRSGTLFSLQDVQALAAEAATPLKRTESNLADAGRQAASASARLPDMEALLPALDAERGLNRRAHRRWRLAEGLRRAARLGPQYAVVGALLGIAGRLAAYYAAHEFQAPYLLPLLIKTLPVALIGAGVGALVGFVLSFRGLIAGGGSLAGRGQVTEGRMSRRER